uniref:CRAL-TRIO domain-containing protein n=2 Tax=Plectus sambesii TaxID=2011161 RepID=A0A914WP59_9BILA
MSSEGLPGGGAGGPSVRLPQNGLKAVDIQHVLRDRVALLSGGRDRNGRPVITFPSRENAERTSVDDLRMVLLYLHAIPGDETKELGFVVLIDMRHGITWNAVKPILKTLQDHFPGTVHMVYIIKPDRFWEKHKASIASAKYKFEVQMISVENLSRFIDPSQLTAEFEGTLAYDHDDWLELRVALENLIWRMTDLLRIFDQMRNEMENAQLPIDVPTAEGSVQSHLQLRKKIQNAPVEALEEEGRRLIHRLTGGVGPVEEHSSGGGDSDYGSTGRDSNMNNPDFTSAAPHVNSLLDILRSTREQLFGQWGGRKQKLDHCYQLKLFEQDADKVG